MSRGTKAGLYKELTATDKKVIEEKINSKLVAYVV